MVPSIKRRKQLTAIRSSVYVPMEPHRKGELTESIVITELKRRQITVATLFGDNERYDLVAGSPDGEFVSFQVKTGWLRDGTIQFKGVSQHTNASGNVYKQYQGDVDYFLIYCYELEALYIVPEEEFDTGMCLRVKEPEQVHETINWAEDYRFDDNWPPTGKGETVQKVEAVSTTINALRETGLTVYRSVDRGDGRSLIAESDEQTYRIRVENGWVVNGRIRFDADADDVDCYLVYCDELDALYTVDAESFNESISLRVDPPKQPDSSINWAEDYRFDANWPPRA